MALPATYRAMRLPAPGPASSFVLTHLPLRRPTKAGDVLVRVDACAVAFRDVLDRTGAFKFIAQPTVLGHEFHGHVVAVGGGEALTGEGERGLRVGDAVVSLHWDQTQAWPSPLKAGGAVGTMLGLTCDGGYAEYCTAPAGCFFRVPSEVSEHFSASALSCVMSTFGTVWQGAVVRGRLAPTDNVLVTGASGGVGSAAVKLCKALGCRVTAVTTSPAKVPFLESLNCDDVIVANAATGAFAAPAHSLVVEAVGGPTFASSLRATAPGGRVVLVGNVENSVAKLPLGFCILNSVSVIGSDSVAATELGRLLNFMVERGIAPTIDRVLPLTAVGDAHELLQSRAVSGRLVIDTHAGDDIK